MITLNSLYELYKNIASKDDRGGVVSIPEFSGIIDQQQVNYFNELLEDYEESSDVSNSLDIFKDEDTGSLVSSSFAIPSDYAKERNLFVTYAVVSPSVDYGCDMITDLEYRKRITDILTAPCITYPVYRMSGGSITVYPDTYVTSAYTFEYLRYPLTANLDYYIDVNGRYQTLSVGATHTWTTGEIDSSGTTHTTGDTDWTSLTVELEFRDKDKLEIFSRVMTVIGVRMESQSLTQYFGAETIKLDTDG